MLIAPTYLGCVADAPQLDEVEAQLAGGPIVGLAGKCLDAKFGGTVNGTAIQLWTCNGTVAQRWALQGNTLTGPGNKCLDVSGNNQVVGAKVQLYDCNGTDAQKWTLRGGALVSTRGLCLDVAGNNASDGAVVQLWSCNGGENQRWSIGSTRPPSAVCRHFHPGNYLRELDSRAGNSNGLAALDADLGPQGYDLTNFAGFLYQIDWAMVETSRGVYDFSRLDAALQKVEAHGKNLRIKLMDRTFHHGCNPSARIWPSYATGVPSTYDSRTCYSDVWNPATVDGLAALHIAIAKRYSDRLAFAGFTSEEMAIGPTDAENRTRAEYAQRVRLAQLLFAAAPDAIFISEFNWPLYNDRTTFPGLIEQTLVKDATGKVMNGMGVSWPDSWLNPSNYTAAEQASVLPRFQCTQSETVSGKVPCNWYNVGRDYRHKVVVAPAIEGGGVLKGTRVEAENHYRMMDDDIGAHMITWDTWDQYNTNYIRSAVIPVVNAHGGKLKNATCPFE